MLKSFKTLTTLAAIGMTLYAAHWFAHMIPAVRKFAHSVLPTATVYDDAYYGAWLLILMATILLTIVVFIRDSKMNGALPKTSFCIVTYITCGIAILSAVTACLNARDLLYVTEPLYPPFTLQLILFPLAIVWFWLLSWQPGVGRLSKAFRIVAIVGIVLLCLPLLRMTASAIYYCCTGYLLYFNTWASATNTILFIPTFLLTWYSIELCIYNQQMRIEEPKSAAKIKITAPKSATNPWVEVVKKEAEQKLSNVEAVQNRVKRLLGLGYPVWNDSLQKCDLLEVKLWDPDYSTANVTICCNRLLEHFGHAGTIVIDTEVSCISWRNIEYQSCGFELIHIEHKPDDGGASKALFYLRVKRNRETLFIPKGDLNQDNGFSWRMRQNEIKQLTYPDYQLPPDVIANYRPVEPHFYVPGYQYILSFTVTGEFNLEAYFVPDKADVHIPIYGGGFCCK